MADEASLEEKLSRASKVRSTWEAKRVGAASRPVNLGELIPAKGLQANKDFISRTVQAVDGHNRRVEEDACWASQRTSLAPPPRAAAGPAQGVLRAQADERAAWAARKQLALNRDARGGVPPAATSDAGDAAIDEGDTKKRKRDGGGKKEKKAKKAKKEKKSKKKKKAASSPTPSPPRGGLTR
ncbi:hypothetical protein M885DRAFT_627134 [Pelagophyceae sp. CCMP2097]|nr:hypothetical protein M885DRAFT_627134 [Pelagophyceae sp. CCMP2097]